MYEPVELARDTGANCASDQRTSQASQSASAPPIVVTLVHGTFAKGALWTKDGSVLRQEIAAELGRQEKDVIFDVFEWSGRNTHKARVKAGYQLADHVRELKKRYPLAKHFIVAHSHGGNVALLAHKHLPSELHATGIATLGTPFIYAELPEDIAHLDDAGLRATREGSIVLTILGLFFTVAIAMTVAILAYEFLNGRGWGDSSLGIAFIVGWLVLGLVWEPMTKAVAWITHPISPQRAAMKLGQALALKPIPQTHVLSFIYPGDEAGLVLNTLEKTSMLPTMAVRWYKHRAAIVGGVLLWVFALAAMFSEPIAELLRIGPETYEYNTQNAAYVATLIGGNIWLALVVARYLLSILRGHPAGFGWERPSIHAHVDIGVRPVARLSRAKSNTHQEVPFTAEQDAKRGLRHSGLYEDKRILKALAHWMAHVK